MGKDDDVRVAIRVRPFKQGIDPPGAKLTLMCDQMSNVHVNNPETGATKRFDFDYAFWSHNHKDPNYIDQDSLYNMLGKDLLSDIWDGYHVCLFAYGQSGAGKSYSMTGGDTDETRGIVPRLCEDLIAKIHSNEAGDPNVKYTLSLSMLEIYMEKINDLLSGQRDLRAFKTIDPQRPQDPKQFRVPQLTKHPIKTVKEIMMWLSLGERARAKGATSLNDKSSRAHTVFELTLERRENIEGVDKDKVRTTTIRLIDLAGSERIAKSKTKGVRAREGASINTSLTYLGLCIKQLAEATNEKNPAKRERKLKQIPWIHTVLTRLLEHSLTGNCKVMMIAAVSPSHHNYAETVSTLRYATSCKRIKNPNVAPVQSDMDRLIESLQKAEAENKKLKALLSDSNKDEQVLEELNQKREELEMMKQMSKSKEAKSNQDSILDKALLEEKSFQEKLLRYPHITNLHPDDQVNNKVVHFLPPGDTTSGNATAHANKDKIKLDSFVPLFGLRVLAEHCVFRASDDGVDVVPASDKASVFVNGKPVKDKMRLQPYDRLILGTQNYFLFKQPGHKDIMSEEKYKYTFANEELLTDQVKPFLESVMDDPKKKELEETVAALKAAMEQQAALSRERDEEMQKRLQDFESKQKADEEQKDPYESETDKQDQHRLLEEARLQFEKEQKESQAELRRLKELLEEQEKVKKDRETVDDADESKRLLEHNIVRAFAQVRDANDIANALKVPVHYEVKPMSGKYGLGEREGSQIFVKVHRKDLDMVYFWHYDEFQTHMEGINEIYMVYELTEQIKIPKDDAENPFFDPIEKPIPIGEAGVMVLPLAMLVEMENENSPIISFAGEIMGTLHYSLVPLFTDDEIIDAEDVRELKGKVKHVDFELSIHKMTGLKTRYASRTHVTFSLPSFMRPIKVHDFERKQEQETKDAHEPFLTADIDDDSDTESENGQNNLLAVDQGPQDISEIRMKSYFSKLNKSVTTNPTIDYKQTFRIEVLNDVVFEFLEEAKIEFEAWGSLPPKQAIQEMSVKVKEKQATAQANASFHLSRRLSSRHGSLFMQRWKSEPGEDMLAGAPPKHRRLHSTGGMNRTKVSVLRTMMKTTADHHLKDLQEARVKIQRLEEEVKTLRSENKNLQKHVLSSLVGDEDEKEANLTPEEKKQKHEKEAKMQQSVSMNFPGIVPSASHQSLVARRENPDVVVLKEELAKLKMELQQAKQNPTQQQPPPQQCCIIT